MLKKGRLHFENGRELGLFSNYRLINHICKTRL